SVIRIGRPAGSTLFPYTTLFRSGMPVELDGEKRELRVRPFPQGRNGIPNPAYDGGKGYLPRGAVSTYQVEVGGRCQGNNNCVPIDRKSTRLNSSHVSISYAVFCL